MKETLSGKDSAFMQQRHTELLNQHWKTQIILIFLLCQHD